MERGPGVNSGYSNYLFFVVLFTILFLILLIFLINYMRKNRKKPLEAWEREPISSGSVSVFFDPDKNITVLPYAKNKYGIGKAIAIPQYLKYPYPAPKAGRTIRYSMKISSEGAAGTNAELMASLGCRDWQSFSAGKKNVSVHFDEKRGIVMIPTRMRGEGAYEFIDGELKLEGKADDKEIGEALMTLLSRCK